MTVIKYLDKLDPYNPWIIKWFLIIAFARNLPSVFSMFSFQFTGKNPESFHCRINRTENESLFSILPLEYVKSNWTYSSCKQFLNNDKSLNKTVSCQNGYSYSLENFYSSTISEWDLVCERSFLNSIATSSFFVVSFIGSIVSCSLSDRYGRKPVFLVTFTCLNIGELLLGLSPNVYIYILLKLFTGTFQQGCFVTGFTMILELFTIKNRANACLVDTLIWSLAYCLLDLIAYLLRTVSWRYYFVCTSLIVNIPFMFLYFKLPESIRWLVSKNRTEEAKKLLLQAGQHCKPKLKLEDLNEISRNDCEIENENLPIYNITDIFKHSLLFRYQAIGTFIWFSTAISYIGLQVKVVNIGNPFINFLLGGLVEIPANVFVYPFANRFGRKPVQFLSTLTIAVVIGLGYICIVYETNIWISTCFFLAGKMFSCGLFNIIFMHVGEIFPTTLRSTALGMSTSSARFGISVAAVLFDIKGKYEYVPFVISAMLNIICFLLTFFLPETYKSKMPDTIQEMKNENSGKRLMRFS